MNHTFLLCLGNQLAGSRKMLPTSVKTGAGISHTPIDLLRYFREAKRTSWSLEDLILVKQSTASYTAIPCAIPKPWSKSE